MENFNWFSFFIGMSVGFLMMNLIQLAGAYVRREKARKDLKEAENKLKAFESELMKKKEELVSQIREAKK